MAQLDTSRPASPTAIPGRSKFNDTIRSLRHRNFQLFFSGQLISLIGTWMQNVAQSWLVYRLTGSSLLLGTVSFAGQIPVFPMAPLAGMVADRWNRRTIVIVTQTASMILAFILAALTLTNRIKVWEIVALAAALGIVNAFDIPARQSFLVEMVGREDLMNAIALNSSIFNSARIIGPAIAGAVSGAASPATAIVVEAGVMLVSTVLVAVNPHVRRAPDRARRQHRTCAA